MKEFLLVLTLAIIIICQAQRQLPALAGFNMNGTWGRVIFEKESPGSDLIITPKFKSLPSTNSKLEIRRFPPFPGQLALPCGRLGSVFNPSNVQLAKALGSLSDRLDVRVTQGDENVTSD